MLADLELCLISHENIKHILIGVTFPNCFKMKDSTVLIANDIIQRGLVIKVLKFDLA